MTIALSFALMLATAGAAAPATNLPRLVPGPEVLIAGDPAFNHWESMIVVDPTDPRRLLASCIVTSPDRDNSAWYCRVFSSEDGGATWTQSIPNPDRAGDPVVAFGPDGEAYFACLMAQTPEGRPIGVYRSDDGGKTWSGEAAIPFWGGVKADHEMILVDCTEGEHRGTLYAAAQYSDKRIRLHRSTDGGRSFETAILADSWDAGFVDNLALFADGTLLVPIRTRNVFLPVGEDKRYAGADADHFAVTSSDGGVTFAPPVKMFTKSNRPSTGRGGGGPAVYAIGSHGISERVYAVWVDRSTGQSRMYLVTSDDKAQTWSERRDITAAMPDGSGPGVSNVAVTRDGTVGISWYQHHAEGGYDLYFMASTDGGESFSTPLRVSTETSKGSVPGDMRYPGGDYTFMAASPDGAFHIVWSDARSGQYQLFTRSVRRAL
jgi:hypothetical protein